MVGSIFTSCADFFKSYIITSANNLVEFLNFSKIAYVFLNKRKKEKKEKKKKRKCYHWNESQEILTLLSAPLVYLFMGFCKSPGLSFLICTLLKFYKENSTTRGKSGEPGVTLTMTPSLHGLCSATVMALNLDGRAQVFRGGIVPFSRHHLKQKNRWDCNVTRDPKSHP